MKTKLMIISLLAVSILSAIILWSASSSATNKYFEGTDNNDYIIFGHVEVCAGSHCFWQNAGVGFCVFVRGMGETKGDFVNADATTTVYDNYIVSANNGHDVMEFAPKITESCGSKYLPIVGEVKFRINANIPSTYDGKSQLFYGDAGGDSIYLCNRTDSSVCWTKAGYRYASGGDYDDVINGSNGDDVLSGDDGWDVIYGRDGIDLLLGGLGDDMLFGGKGDDCLECGGQVNDTCWCGEGEEVYGDQYYECPLIHEDCEFYNDCLF